MTDSIKLTIWGRDFSLAVDYNCYPGEKVTSEQTNLVKLLSEHGDWIDNSKSKVEAYCQKRLEEGDSNLNKDNIFSYIKPDYIFVKHDDSKRIAIMCKCKYEPELGLAIVFNDKGEIEVGIQDIIL